MCCSSVLKIVGQSTATNVLAWDFYLRILHRLAKFHAQEFQAASQVDVLASTGRCAETAADALPGVAMAKNTCMTMQAATEM